MGSLSVGGSIHGRSKCCLCSQIAGEPGNDLIARLLRGAPYLRRVMMESTMFAAVPSLGPLAPGHTLLCPKEHLPSFGQSSLSSEREYAAIKDRLRQTLERTFGGEVHLFEHGMARERGRVLCTVDHAHLHFVPLPPGMDVLEADPLDWTEYDGSLRQLIERTSGREYLLYETPRGEGRLHCGDSGKIESQHMRRLLARELGHADQWNWRSRPDAEQADRTWCRVVRSTPTRHVFV